ncbi:MAG: stage II sporulation protein D [Christensenellales bacterium]
MRKRQRRAFLRRIVLLGLCVMLPILIVRGCIIANSKTDEARKKGPLVTVYDAAQKSTFVTSMEEYLVGVVAGEMPYSFHAEALKAQAVAARTYTARKLSQYGGGGCSSSGYDICTDSGCCQAWTNPESFKGTSKYQKIRDAVFSTAGEVAVYDGKLIEALFHSTAGGYTENSENVFSTALPYLRSVYSNETNAPRYESMVSVSRSQFAKKLESATGEELTEENVESKVAVAERFESGRVKTVAVGGETLTGREFRSLFNLDSANFTIEYGKEEVLIHTRGFGHGVGMSQTGADSMAKDGESYIYILKYYYTGISIERYW